MRTRASVGEATGRCWRSTCARGDWAADVRLELAWASQDVMAGSWPAWCLAVLHVNQRVIGYEANQFCMGCMGLDVASFGTVALCAAVHAWEGPCGSRPIIWCGRLTYVGMVERKAFEGGRQAIGPESVGRARQQASCCY